MDALVLAAIVESSDDAIISKNLNSIITSWNKGAEKIFGYTAAEMIGTSIMRLIPADRQAEECQIIAKIRRGERVEHFETLRQTKDSRFIEVSVTASPIMDSAGAVTGISKVARDITERKQAQRALRASEERLRFITDNARVGLVMVNQERCYTFANGAYAEILGLPSAEIIGQRVADVLAPIYESQIRPRLDRAFAGERVSYTLHKPASGGERCYTVKYEPTKDGGLVLYVVVVITDITEQNRAEEELTVKRAQLNSALAAGAIGTWTWDIVNDRLVADEFTARMFSIDADKAAKGQPAQAYLNAIYENDLPGVSEALARAIQSCGKYDIQYRVRQNDGSLCWLQARGRVEGDSFGKALYFHGAVMDITARMHAEEAMRASEARYRALFEYAPDGILIADTHSNYVDANASMCRMLGYSRDELIGMNAVDIVSPTEVSHIETALKKITADSNYQREWLFRRKDGTSFNAEVIATQMPDGNLLGMVRDITAQRKLEEQFRQAQKMEAVGQLAGGIAHDFNNLLTIINGHSELMQTSLKLDDSARKQLALIHQTGMRAAVLTRQLLAFSRQQVLAPQTIDLNAIISDLEAMLKRLLPENIDVVTVLAADLERMKADPGQVEQVIMNLMVNARDAMPDGGKITIETSNRELNEDYCKTRQEVSPGKYVLMMVSDTGFGMSAATRARIFEPFFTTKEQGKGTGLGLSTVFGIVKQSKGHIDVYSEVNKGTTFKIYLPQTAEAAAVVEGAAPSPMPRGHERIMIVEDEEGVRELMCEILQISGYTVLLAKNGEEALQIFEKNADCIDLIVTDVVMPGMGGTELVGRIRAISPRTKVIFSSGYPNHAIVRHGELPQGVNFVQKPFSASTLIRKVRDVLDSSDPN